MASFSRHKDRDVSDVAQSVQCQKMDFQQGQEVLFSCKTLRPAPGHIETPVEGMAWCFPPKYFGWALGLTGLPHLRVVPKLVISGALHPLISGAMHPPVSL